MTQPLPPTHRLAVFDQVYEDLLAVGFTPELAGQWVDDLSACSPDFSLSRPWWFDTDAVDELLCRLMFSDHARQVLRSAADRVRTQAPQCATYAAVEGELYLSAQQSHRTNAINGIASPEARWDELSRLHRAMAYLHMLPQMVRRHEELGIPFEVTVDTARDFSDRVDVYSKMHPGRVGMHDEGWFTNHIRLALFKLGRLQYAPIPFADKFYVFENEQGRVQLMLEAGLVMREDGQYATADHMTPQTAPYPWTSMFAQTDTSWQGHLIDERGCAGREVTQLTKKEWRCVLAPGDNILAIHIPEGQPLLPQACVESFEKARLFFPKYFSYDFKAVTCVSWLMDPQLVEALPANSNLSGFIKLFHPYPVANASDWQFFERIFGGPVQDLNKAPRDTGLRRVILDEIARGRHWRTGGGVRLVRSGQP